MLLTDNPSKYATLLAAVTKLLGATQGRSVPAHRTSDTAKHSKGMQQEHVDTQVNSKTILQRTKDSKAHFKVFHYNKVYNKNIGMFLRNK